MPTSTNDPLAAAWLTLTEQHWTDAARHQAFVALAGTLDRLPDAAAFYRAVETDPARAEGAARGKQLVLAHALARLEAAPRASRAAVRRRAGWLAPLVALGLVLALALLATAITHNRAFVSPPALALEILAVALLPWRRMLQ